MITNNARRTGEIKSNIGMGKAASNKKTLFTSKLVLHFKKKLVECHTWIMVVYGAETWTAF
jgi:hypothetical protein